MTDHTNEAFLMAALQLLGNTPKLLNDVVAELRAQRWCTNAQHLEAELRALGCHVRARKYAAGVALYVGVAPFDTVVDGRGHVRAVAAA